MKNIYILMLLMLPIALKSQIVITGTIKDDNNHPLIGANIYIKGTYTGATSDTNGYFRLSTTLKDTCRLVAAYIGYETYEKKILLNKKTVTVDFQLSEKASALDQVVISAGTFQAGDKKRSVLLSSLDIVTTANAEGDIYGALSTLPGAQTEGETGKIIVRGGESDEMKTFMDGMLLAVPYTSRMPDIPARGRFSPFLFNGILFSTGGYSAEYGQALSSVLELNTEGLAEESLTSISLLNVGAGLGHTQRFPNSSITLEADYNNLTPFFAMAQHNLDWEKAPESISGQLRFRKKAGNEGMIKSFLSYSGSHSVLHYENYSSLSKERIAMGNKNFFQTTTFNSKIGDKWIIKSGLAINLSKETFDINTDKITDLLRSYHAKVSLNNYAGKNLTLKLGIESFHNQNQKDYLYAYQPAEIRKEYDDYLFAGYTESDIKFLKNLALRMGIRSEYSTCIKEMNVAARMALAYQVNRSNQLSFAFGSFFQQAPDDFLIDTSGLDFEHAVHLIINYQYSDNNRLLRIEAYHKQYNGLIQYADDELTGYNHITNEGFGYARGIDIFWRDKATFSTADYWISYSYIDSKRKYLDFPVSATPYFVSRHNLSVVYKQWISKLETQLSVSYKFRSGRPYYNPNNNNFMSDRTRPYNDISFSMSYLTRLLGNFTIVHCSCSNVFGFNNTFGYHFEQEPDDTGTYQAHPIQPYAKRTFIIAVFISIK